MFLTWLIKVVFYKKKFIITFLLYIKISEKTDLTYYQKTRDVILNRAKDYYKSNKQRLGVQARDKTYLKINLFEEEKNKKREYEKNRYRNISEEKKQRLQKYYRETKRSLNTINKIILVIF